MAKPHLNSGSINEIAARWFFGAHARFPFRLCRMADGEGSFCRGPRIIGAEGPHVALGIRGVRSALRSAVMALALAISVPAFSAIQCRLARQRHGQISRW